mmetsp:Transcript_21684/g.35883  ORF Transcript_21684/g.35883 Transcript_21684/m.35883 type:complete len:136 (+) Transcript_21684:68-475(+)|eukprot:CAMPEP_0184359304 /NCGR_PEP_ID=MMETSP1089-20130417/119483_1 /TAXON_ID=38269 ORGANISM="Gloeochaete wittrockiana, Strain SAG46.84" /NCGR_SAMPLE_ID=MMETSP1089 /ASSEMBLY_ACC=CAM_ASM_000445 /LENGTH=135 /DNA_ID=CAMNT_0026698053 /DNA_START=18 /DNA_END=425 /DNA_ORIENTATION=-
MAIAGKRAQLERERLERIDRENEILVERMSRLYNKGPVNAQQEGPWHPGTLNLPLRRKEAAKITNENLQLLKRLQNVKPTMSTRSKASTPTPPSRASRNSSNSSPIPTATGKFNSRGASLPAPAEIYYEDDFEDF